MDMIRILRRQKKLSQIELAGICGVHQTAVSQWEQGRTKPDLDSLVKMAACFNVSVDMILGTDAGLSEKIPVIDHIRGGMKPPRDGEIVQFEPITADMADSGEHFAIKAAGEAMRPVFSAGDILIVRRQDSVNSGELALVLIGREDAVARRVIKKGTSIMLAPFNAEFEPILFTEDEIRETPVAIIGKIVELRRKYL
ncbi:MAG: helix-turn-helix domain-containing protein [Oscillospiraceae bacterium]|nr:helix-turn-helix domain-containing protein [Oscillospiraceae bacterium]